MVVLGKYGISRRPWCWNTRPWGLIPWVCKFLPDRTFAGCDEQIFGFKIVAVWHERPLIWGSILAVFAGLIIVWQRRERLRAKERLALQEQLAEAELRSKRGQMNPHFLFNALDAISNFIFKNQPKDAVLYMGKLAKLMRLTLESSRNTSMVLADEIDLLEKYIDMCKLRYGSFHWELTVEDGIDIYDRPCRQCCYSPLWKMLYSMLYVQD